MYIDIDPRAVMHVFLSALRIGVLFILTPVFANLSGLVTVRVLLTIALSVLLGTSLAPQVAAPPMELGPLLGAAVSELVVGSVLSFGVFAAFAAFSVAGKILDIQTGFSIGGVYDPVTRSGAPIFATMLNLAGVAMFFALEGHHALVRGIAFSLQEIPPGSGLPGLDAQAVVRQFGLMFSLGVSMAGPVMFCLFLVEIALAVVSRTMPQMNVLVIGVPVKIVAGIAVLAFTAAALGPAMGKTYASIFTFWEQVLD